jgi:hypothetical protein
MDFKDLIGKTIVSATQKKLIKFDDDGFLELIFSDGTKAVIVAYYGGYTGHSEDEYPTGIAIYEKYSLELTKI